MNKIGYKTSFGECICGDSLELIKTLEDKSVNLALTSPPFALQRQKAYGNETQDVYVDWLCQFAGLMFEKLSDDGSLVMDIGGAYEKGIPAYSLYQFRVLIKLCDEYGYKLAQPFYWHNPSALPAPIEWVNKRKVRAKTSVNTIWWLCKNPMSCKANITNVLVPYSKRMQQLIANPDEFFKEKNTLRPSGHVLTKASWQKDNGGAIPPNMLQFTNTESNSHYLKYCKENNVQGHPARFPLTLPDFFIKFLTDEHDLVVDFFGGSNTTGQAAEKLRRRWKTFEISREYVATSVFRFTETLQEARDYYNSIMNGNLVEIYSKNRDLFDWAANS
ncbi:MAG: site-specific DNA-methyltransferase [Victivallales bacterium]|nr:site-specific DNA-methyltransferase [Victivallales bacterium]